MKKRVIFRDTGEEVGTIYRDGDGRLIATTERVQWITEQSIDIGARRIQPEEDDFLDFLPIAYAGALFSAELVEE